jgi:CRP/FNR family cyclic AMP-dependent transcriptional regulator
MRSPYGLELVESCVTCKLRKDNFFCSFSHSLLPLLDTIKLANVFPKGTVLFAAGQKPAGIHVVCAGKVKLCTDSANGKSMVVKLVGPGEVLGLHACIGGTPQEFNAETVQPSHIVFVKADDFRRLLAENQEVCWQAAQFLSRHCSDAYDMLRSVNAAHSASEKLARLLLEVSVIGTGTRAGIRVNLPFTHKEIAQAIGMSRETVWRKLAEFRAMGVAVLEGSVLLIRNKAALERLAGRSTPSTITSL